MPAVATVPRLRGYKHPMQPGIPFDTTNVLFICGGAFVGPEEIIAKRLGRGGFGFDQLSENCQVVADGLLRHVKPESLQAFGMIREILGRLPAKPPFDAFGVDSSIHERGTDPAVQETRQVPRCGLDVHRCGTEQNFGANFEQEDGA